MKKKGCKHFEPYSKSNRWGRCNWQINQKNKPNWMRLENGEMKSFDTYYGVITTMSCIDCKGWEAKT